MDSHFEAISVPWRHSDVCNLKGLRPERRRIMTKRRTLYLLWLLWPALGLALSSGSRADNTASEQAVAITIVMEDCKSSRPGKITNDTSMLRLLFSGPPKEELVK